MSFLRAYPLKWFHKPGELLANLLQLPRLPGTVPLSSEAKELIRRASQQAEYWNPVTEKDRAATEILDRTYASVDRPGTWPAFSKKEKTDAADLVKKVLEPLISGKTHTVSVRTETKDYMNFLSSKNLNEEFRRGLIGEHSAYRHPGGKLQVGRRIDTAGRDGSGRVITLNPKISDLTEEEAARFLTAEQVKLYDRFAQSLLEATGGKPVSGSIMDVLATPPSRVINELLPKFPREGYEFFGPESDAFLTSSSPNRQLLRHLLQIGTTPAIGAGVTGVGGYGAYRMGKQSADAYVRGFAQKCSEAGVNPQQLIKLAKDNQLLNFSPKSAIIT